MSDAEDVAKGAEAAESKQEGGVDVQRRLERLDGMISDLDRARAGGRIIRLLVVVLLALIVLGVGLKVYGYYKNVRANAPAYQEALRREMGTLAVGARTKLMETGQALLPVYQKAVQEDWAKNGDKVMKAIESEGEKFVRNTSRGLQESLEEEMNALVKSYDVQFGDAFPQLKDEKTKARVVDALKQSIAVATAALIEDYMMTTVELMLSINEEATMFLPKDKQPAYRRTVGRLMKTFDRQVSNVAEGR